MLPFQSSAEVPGPRGLAWRCLWRMALLVGLLTVALTKAAAAPPNILWFVVDDMSANFSCYGETLINTPHVDRLAREGTRFVNAFVTAPVCSPCRSAMITGMYQTSIGAHHHRSGRGERKIHLPEGVVPIPALFQRAGYFTCIGSGLPGIDERGLPTTNERQGKTDYNFQWDAAMYDGHDWKGRQPGQPFFMQVQLPGGKLRGNDDRSAAKLADQAKREFGQSVDAKMVQLPPYYPRDPVLLHDWSAYLDSVRLTDLHVGRVLDRLEEEGLIEETVVIFMTDHGISHARGKQFLYDEGTHIPFVVRGPGIAAGVTRSDLIEHIDMAAVSLAAAGIALPSAMQAQDVFSSSYQPREAVFAARDRCDETVERLRSVRTEEYLYIRNFHPGRPHLQPNAYKDGKQIVQRLRELERDEQLDSLAKQLLFRPVRPIEELYRWKEDRWQVHNLADEPSWQSVLLQLRDRLDRWIVDTKDQGPESEEMYDSDMAVYLGDRGASGRDLLQRNIDQMKRWAHEGK